MLIILILSAVVLIIYLLCSLLRENERQWRKIPGPSGLPVLGCAHLVNKARPYETFMEWSGLYGDVVAFRLFQQRVLVLSGLEPIREALVTRGQDFGGRPKKFRSTYMSDNGNDIVSAPISPAWSALKRVTMRELNRFDPGHRRLELLTLNSLNDFFKRLEQHEVQDFDPRGYVYDAIINTICVLLVGEKLKEESEELELFKRLERLITRSMNVGGRGSELDVLPWLRFFGNETYSNLQLAKEIRDKLYDWVQSKVSKDLQDGQPCLGVLHGLFSKLQTGEEPVLTDNKLKLTIVNLLIGGVASTTAYLYLLINILIHYPQVQQRLREEVDQVVGGDRDVSLSDRESMPYCKAILLELLRYGSLSPLLIPHVTLRDTSIGPHSIPKDTWVFVNIRALHHSESYWGDPYVFRPERFLDVHTKKLFPLDHPHRRMLLSFGGGPRACPGESLARSRLFLVLASLVQKYRQEPPERIEGLGPCDPRTYNMGLVLEPKSFSMRCVKRKS